MNNYYNFTIKEAKGLFKSDLYFFDIIDSTNTWILNNSSWLKHGDTVEASEQTSGHGRFLRRWYARYRTSLLMSIALNTSTLPPISFQWLTLGAAIAIHQTLAEMRITSTLKWPNDVLVNNKKIAGILAETTSANKFTALGIGLNVNQERKDFPVEISNNAISAKMISGKCTNIEDIRMILMGKLEKNISLIYENNVSALYKVWTKYDSFPGKKIKVTINGNTFLAIYKGVTKDGTLQIIDENQKSLLVSSGDVTLAF